MTKIEKLQKRLAKVTASYDKKIAAQRAKIEKAEAKKKAKAVKKGKVTEKKKVNSF